MATPTQDFAETVTGLYHYSCESAVKIFRCASGVQAVLAFGSTASALQVKKSTGF